jgi:ParB family chromosome partitioning protein
MRSTHIDVPLSHLVAGKRNPRRVKPAQEAHHKLVALIRAHGLLQPLVVRCFEGDRKKYQVIAGNRRLAALKEIHKGNGDPKIHCLLKDVNAGAADALSLGENFGREPMHPLDEAEAFAKLATGEGKDARAIAAEFGVNEKYVRQRMQLASLAAPIKQAHRQGEIDTAMAEAFAAVPEDRQMQICQELGGQPHSAEQIRQVIAHSWIEASKAIFDVSTLPDDTVRTDLFNEQVLIERSAFMEAQQKALLFRQEELKESGWAEVVVAPRHEVQDQLYAMEEPDRSFDSATQRKLDKLTERREKLEGTFDSCEDDPEKLQRLQSRLEELESQTQEIVDATPVQFTEETKSRGSAFVMLNPDGGVEIKYRVPRQRAGESESGENEAPKPLTADDLNDRQLAETYTQHAFAVREGLLGNESARKRLLVLILHEAVRSDALSVRRDMNATSLHAGNEESFSSPSQQHLSKLRAKLDPFADAHFLKDTDAYEKLSKLSNAKLDSLIDLLIVECVTADLRRPTELVFRLGEELKINLRKHWKPDANWLSGYRKIQLLDLLTTLTGTDASNEPERKKSELVDTLAKLFHEAADGTLEDKAMADRVNAWLPSNLRRSNAEVLSDS